MKYNRRNKTSSIFEIVAITLLSAALVVMFIQYCLLKNSASVSTTINSDHSFLQNKDNGNESDFSSSGIVAPEFIGFSAENKLFAPTSSDARRKLMSEARPFVLAAFSDISTVMEFSSETAKDEYIKNLLSESGDYLYFRFPHELPAGCFVPAVGGYALENIFHAFSVKDLFIFCSDTGEISGIAIDDGGNLASLSVRDRSSLSMESLAAIDTTDGYTGFEFLPFANKKYPVLTSSVALRNLAAYNEAEDLTQGNDEKVSEILSTFGFNPNSTSFYRTDDALTYVQSSGELSISSDGSITFASSGSGIPMSEFLSEQKNSFSFEDKMIAARNVIGELDTEIFGGYASLCLYAVSYDEGLLTVDLAYTADGMLISDTKGCARLVFDDNSLVNASIAAKSFARLDSSYTDIPQKLLFAFAASSFDKELAPAGFPIVYAPDENSVYVARSALLENVKKEDEK